MAKIGLSDFRYGALTEAPDGTPSYGQVNRLARAISCQVEVSNNSAMLYADNVLVESDTSFQGGTITLTIDEDDNETMANILGHTITSDGVLIRNSNDSAPWLGFGRVVKKMVNGVYKFKVEFLYKVKFSEPSADNSTQGENVEFATTEIEGTLAALASGAWAFGKVFDTREQALSYLEGIFANPPIGSIYTVTYDSNGGTGTIPSVPVSVGLSITLNDGSALTPPAGKQFSGWATTSAATTPDVNSPYTPTGDVTLYAVWTDI